MWITIAVIVLFAAPASAINANTFANNAASDLGPLITLFGDNVTTQFLKSSFTVFDSILFAMAPIGIITAITSAIRVGSIKLLKTLIGRSRESLESVEIELLSSTSQNVSEIWNGCDLVRESGNGNVLEVVYRRALIETPKTPTAPEEHKDPQTQAKDIEAGLKNRICSYRDLKASIKTRDDAGSSSAVSPKEISSTQNLESGEIEKSRIEESPYFAPNISLNFQNPEKYSSAVRRGQPKKLRAVEAAFAVAVQTGVLAFFGVLTFKLNLSAGAGNPSPKVGFGLTFSGTIFLVLGMFICATIIDRSTLEENWSVQGRDERRDEKRDAFELFWVQNRKSDQDGIESWILFSDEPHYVLVTSHPNKDEGIESFQNVSVCFGVGLGISGFLMQLFGIRMMHWSAAIAQLVATLIMMAVRAVSRSHLSQSPEARSLPGKYELDWVAMRLERKPSKPATGDEPCLFKSNPDDRRVCGPDNSCPFWSKGCWKWSVALDRLDRNENAKGFSKDPNLDGDGHLVFTVRQRLGYMSNQTGTKWTAPKIEIATAISKVIDDIMSLLYVQRADPLLLQTKFWSMPVCVCDRGTADKCRGCNQDIYFRVHWDNKTRRWKSVPEEIEAYLSLWLFELKSRVDSDSMSYPQSRRLATRTPDLEDDLRRWGGPEVESILKRLGVDSDRDHEEDGGNKERANNEDTSNDESGNDREGNEEDGKDELGNDGGNDEGGNEEEYDDNGDNQDHEECNNNKAEDKHNCTEENDIVLSFEASLPTLCAHQLLFRFLQTVISDNTFVKINGDGVLQHDNTSKSWRDFRFKNNHITNLAQKIKDSGLMCFEHALAYTVVALSHAKKLPDCPGILDYIRLRALDFKSRRQFSDAAGVYEWILLDNKSGSQRMITGACALSFVFREQLKEIISVMESEAPFAEGQDTAQDEIKSAEAALQQVEGALSQMPHDIIQKLEHLFEKHNDKVPNDSSIFPEEVPDDLGWNVVHYSVVNHRYFDKTLLNKPDMFGRTPLHEVAKRGFADQTRSLIEKGAHLDAEDEEGKTALHVAAEYGQLYIMEMLVLAGASIRKVDTTGKSALHWLSHARTLYAWPMLARLLGGEFSRFIRGSTAAEEVELKIKPLMIRFRNVTDLRDRNGRAALHLAAGLCRNNVLLEQFLQMNDGNEVNAQDAQGMTPLHVAAQSGKGQAIGLLLKAGAEINARNWFQQTALHLAVKKGHLWAVNQLLENGASCKAKDLMSSTALHVAAETGYLDIAKLLVAWGANVSARGSNKQTPLHYAAAKNDEVMVDWLLSTTKGKGVDDRDVINRTPLGLALFYYEEGQGLGAIQCLLREEGENPLNAVEFLERVQPQLASKLHAAAENEEGH
ncbi:hypothetical protein G7Y89_g11056 [Cudoniella acicularis]|uniref:Uncharacterized protein n=1 Tax=Cudoniella acicularis TaxID=354080 RepID=A0A8H4VYE4_9HELO|nr:hypothetical protein G7Y89_g11056 [Cudoniella acicularis]